MPPDEHAGEQEEEQREETWMYPSEQMFFNALKRKGYAVREEEM